MDRREQLQAAGRWLRAERERRETSVRQLAAQLDVATQVIYDWQNGKNAVSDENASRLARLWGLPEIQVRRHLGLWVPREDDADEADLPSPEDFEGIVTQLPDGSEVSYAIRRDRLAQMSSDDLRRLAQEMIEHVMEIERQRGTQGTSDT